MNNNYLKYNKMKKILFMCLIALGMMFTSCNPPEIQPLHNYDDLTTEETYSPYNMFDSIVEFNGHSTYTVFQVLYENEGLATFINDVVYIVSETPIYDGLEIRETENKKFHIMGTYTYYTVGDKRKVVPVIMLLDVN